ncbi:D-isomer specific 2-hydroxyacid dehydrogenase family protein [soil metagenome]
MSDILIASQFESDFNEQLRAHALRPTVIDLSDDRPWEAAGEADVLFVRPTPTWRANRTLARPKSWPGRLRWVNSGSVGIDPYPGWLLDAPLVTCGRGVSSEEIADYVLAAIYLQSKDLEAVRARNLSEWKQTALGRVNGTTVGIIGLGAIGAAVARRAIAAGARVTAARRRRLPSEVEGVELLDDLAQVVASADHIVLAVPATAATRGLVDAALLAHARPHAHLINIARGSVVDQQALLQALDAGRLGFATLDVTDPEPLPADHPLWTHPLVRLTPHVSSNFTQTRDTMFDRVSANLDRFAAGETLADIVDPVAGY